MGDSLMYLLMVIYLLAAIAYAYEGNYPKAIYFIGAIILSVGVLMA